LSQNQIKEILNNYKIVAVVGLSKEPEKDSHKVSVYLKQQGYRIIPVNPFADEVLDEKSYPSLLDIPSETAKSIEVVNIFRRADDVPSIIDQAITLKKLYGKPFVVWMQRGIINEQAAEKAKQAGMAVIMDKCLMVEHHLLS
jgi:uncharacterized protein